MKELNDKICRAELLISIDPASYDGITLLKKCETEMEELRIKEMRKILFNL